MPVTKHQRSDYVHIDSIDPDVTIPISAGDTPLDVNIASPSPLPVTGTVTTTPPDQQPITIADSPAMDAFARLRVSNPTTLFDSQLQYDLHRILWEDKITNGSGSAEVIHHADGSSALLITQPGDEIIRQTRHYFRYQPGKSQMILATFTMGPALAGTTQSVGYGDSLDGIFFRARGADNYEIVLRNYLLSSIVENIISQSSWNIDSFDGNGPSGKTLNFERAQILLIDLEWLGVGRVRVGFVVDGIPYYAHEFLHANNVLTVYMSTANLPVRYYAKTDVGSGSYTEFQAICCSVMSEGGFEVAHSLQFKGNTGTTLRTVTNAVRLPMMAMRPKLTFNGITNRGLLIPHAYEVFSKDDIILWEIWYGATVVGGAWNSMNADSIAEGNMTATSMSGGIRVDAGYLPASNKTTGSMKARATFNYPLTLNIDGAHPTSPYTDAMCLTAISLGGNTDCAMAAGVEEIR